jgi:hypothetical protein
LPLEELISTLQGEALLALVRDPMKEGDAGHARRLLIAAQGIEQPEWRLAVVQAAVRFIKLAQSQWQADMTWTSRPALKAELW